MYIYLFIYFERQSFQREMGERQRSFICYFTPKKDVIVGVGLLPGQELLEHSYRDPRT